MNSRTDVLGPTTHASADGLAHAHAHTVGAILDLIRPDGAGLRVLADAAGAESLFALPTPDEIVSIDDIELRIADESHVSGFDCAVSIDAADRPETHEWQGSLAEMRSVTRGLMLVEAPDVSNGLDPLEETIELFQGLGDLVLVLREEQIPALLMLRRLRVGSVLGERPYGADGRMNGSGVDPRRPRRFAPSAHSPRSVLISIIDPGASGIDVSPLLSCCSPGDAETSDFAILPLMLELRRLSESVATERARADRAQAEAGDLRYKLAELARIAADDRAAREAAEELVKIIGAARGYRIGLAICLARLAVRRWAAAVWRLISAPWRALIARTGEQAPPAER